MAPENAHVFVIEDDEFAQDTIVEVLERGKHKVVLKASSLRDALEAVPTLQEKGIQVATVDGNLRQGDESGRDSKTIVEAIRKNAPQVKTVGLTLNRSGVEGADANVNKRVWLKNWERLLENFS